MSDGRKAAYEEAQERLHAERMEQTRREVGYVLYDKPNAELFAGCNAWGNATWTKDIRKAMFFEDISGVTHIRERVGMARSVLWVKRVVLEDM